VDLTRGGRDTILLGGNGGSFVFLPVLFSPVGGIRTVPEPGEEAGAGALDV
jgi:hypothetical protein